MATVSKTFDVALDLAAPGANRAFTVVAGDSGNVLRITLTDGGEPVDLTGCRVLAVFSKSDGTAAQDSGLPAGGVALRGALNNEVRISLYPQSVAPGMVECELQIYSDEALATLVTTAKFNFMCRQGMLDAETLQSQPQMPILGELLGRVDAVSAAAETAASRADAAAGACEGIAAGSVITWEILRHAGA